MPPIGNKKTVFFEEVMRNAAPECVSSVDMHYNFSANAVRGQSVLVQAQLETVCEFVTLQPTTNPGASSAAVLSSQSVDSPFGRDTSGNLSVLVGY
jgi:hypothetical protein